jgi:hypothetical protein
MSENEFDTNIDNYTIEDLLDILNLSVDYDEEQVKKVTNNIIDKFTEENKVNEVKFFLEVQDVLLERINVKVDKDEQAREAQINYWFENQYAGNEPGVRDIKQRISVFADGSHPVMRRKYLEPRGDISQDQLNPIFQNSYERLIYIDSQYRNNIFPYANNDVNSPTISTNFSIDLTERLKNTVALELESIYVPYEWNTYHESLGNTFFWVEKLTNENKSTGDPSDNIFIRIPNGNYYEGAPINNQSEIYNSLGICNAINRELNKYKFANSDKVGYHWPYNSTTSVSADPSGTDLSWNKFYGVLEVDSLPTDFNNHLSNQIIFKNYGEYPIKIIFYKENTPEARQYCKNNFYANNSLGFMLGYRITPDLSNLEVSMIVPPALQELAYQENISGSYHGNNSLPNVYTHLLTIASPPLTNNDTLGSLGKTRDTAISTNYLSNWLFPGNISNHFFSYISGESSIDIFGPKYLLLVLDDFNHNRINSGAVAITATSNKLSVPSYAGKGKQDCQDAAKNIKGVAATKPRILTQAQLYTANEILSNRGEDKDRPVAPNNSNIFGIITLPLNIDEREYGISSLDIKFKREYFGPVNIDRVKVSLLDDKGNILNLNGRDWFFSIKATELYQF